MNQSVPNLTPAECRQSEELNNQMMNCLRLIKSSSSSFFYNCFFLSIVFNQLDVLVNLYVNNYRILFMDDKNQLLERICPEQQDIIHYQQILIQVNFNIKQIFFLLCFFFQIKKGHIFEINYLLQCLHLHYKHR